jgi:hypothetical protein
MWENTHDDDDDDDSPQKTDNSPLILSRSYPNENQISYEDSRNLSIRKLSLSNVTSHLSHY